MPTWETVAGTARRTAVAVFGRDAIAALIHVAVLLCAVVFVRSSFMADIPVAHYEAQSIFASLVVEDIAIVRRAASSAAPALPRLLFLLIPTLLFVFSRRRLRWTDWEHGRSMRVAIIAIVFALAWTGSTYGYNYYFDRAHSWDRLALVVATIACWRTPLAVPFALRMAVIMLKQADVPIRQDSFDYRTLVDVLVVFSAFTWLSFRRSFQPKHMLLLVLAVFGSYYYASGIAKVNFGPKHSWLLENRLSNLAMNSYIRGWLGFIPENAFIAIVRFVRRFDVAMAVFTAIMELGALGAYFVRPTLTRIWLLLACALHLGIYAMSGIFFWKWIVANLALYFWLRKGGGAQVLKGMCSNVLNLAFGVALIYWSPNRVWFSPQIGVVWYDTRLQEQYDLYAVDANGEKRLVDPTIFDPAAVHWTQGWLCYAAPNERSFTYIYGTAYSYDTFRKLENLENPADVVNLVKRARSCDDAKARQRFEDFMQRWFSAVNRRGRRLEWTRWIGSPRHLWVFPQGELYRRGTKVTGLEIWRTLVVHGDDGVHRLDRRLWRTLPIQ